MGLYIVTKYVQTFTNETTITVRGAQHRLGTADIDVQFLTGEKLRTHGIWSKMTIDRDTFDVVVTFETAVSGRLILWG